jgi:hypothetical protein
MLADGRTQQSAELEQRTKYRPPTTLPRATSRARSARVVSAQPRAVNNWA